MLGDLFWKEQFLATPFDRRLLLLPHCLKNAEACRASYTEMGLDCLGCGACSIAAYREKAEQLGYRVLVAEGTPVVLKIIVRGQVDAILGIACLNVLEKALDRVLLAGIPAYAVPLHAADCRNSRLDDAWVWEVLEHYQPRSKVLTSSYLPALRSTNEMFERDFEHLVPRVRTNGQGDPFGPIVETEAIAYDFLANGGKRFRPFVTLAAYQAMVRAAAPASEAPTAFSDPVRRTAVAIEALHKASLVHDDIEDDDLYRYGAPTLHRRYDTSTAINVGDYLIGLGLSLDHARASGVGSRGGGRYRRSHRPGSHQTLRGSRGRAALAQTERQDPDTDRCVEDLRAQDGTGIRGRSLCRLASGGPDRCCRRGDYDFFPAAGYRLSDPQRPQGLERRRQQQAGRRVRMPCPCARRCFWPLALEAATEDHRRELLEMLAGRDASEVQLTRLREIYEACDVFTKADHLIEKSRERARAVAQETQPEPLRQLLHFLV